MYVCMHVCMYIYRMDTIRARALRLNVNVERGQRRGVGKGSMRRVAVTMSSVSKARIIIAEDGINIAEETVTLETVNQLIVIIRRFLPDFF